MSTDTVTKAVTFNVRAHVLNDLLTGAALATDKKMVGSALNCVRLIAKNGDLIAVSTDRYRLHLGTAAGVYTPESGDFEISIPLNWVKGLQNNLKDLAKSQHADIILSVEDGFISISTDNGSTKYATNPDRFPPYEHLFTDTVSAESIPLNPKFLADLAKLPGIDKNTPLVLKSTGEKKAITARVLTASILWDVLIMPMKVSN